MTSAVVRDPAPPRVINAGALPVAGAASTALRGVLRRPRRAARVIAVFPSALYLELREGDEPKVVAVVGSDAVRLPNAVVLGAGSREAPFGLVRETDDAWIGDASIDITGHLPGGAVQGPRPDAPYRLRVRVHRWWEPTPALPPTAPIALAQAAAALETTLRAEGTFGLAGHPEPRRLAGRCAAGDLAQAVDAAERIVGLGPGLTPSGDDVLAGLLVSLRLLGGAVPDGQTAVWMADWIGAAVTAHARTRTTALAATLLHCAARGQAGVEVAAVLRGLTGAEPVVPALRRLLTAGHTSGSDLAWGLLAGCRATLTLADPRWPGRIQQTQTCRPGQIQETQIYARARRATA